MKSIMSIAFVLIVLAAPARAGINEGLASAWGGGHVTALHEFRSPADLAFRRTRLASLVDTIGRRVSQNEQSAFKSPACSEHD